jgi:AcrR family transcriptional regulator
VPRQALISRKSILDATLALAEERGLETVSMRAVAARLDVTPMALYHHVRDKGDLLDGLVERLLAELPLPDPSLPPEERLRALADSMRKAASRHPDTFLMLLRRPVATPEALALREVVYDALREAGAPDELVPRIERLLSTFVIGFAASEAAGRFAAHEQAVRDADFDWAREQILAAVEASRKPRRARARTPKRTGGQTRKQTQAPTASHGLRQVKT